MLQSQRLSGLKSQELNGCEKTKPARVADRFKNERQQTVPAAFMPPGAVHSPGESMGTDRSCDPVS